MTSVDADHRPSGPIRARALVWIVVFAALCAGLAAAALFGPAQTDPLLSAAVIVAGAITFGVINLWDALSANHSLRLLAEDEALLRRSREIFGRTE